MLSKVSAATMPPIEWPTSMTLTEGSIVGDGVLDATSRSMTLFCSLYTAHQRFDLYCRASVHVPFFEASDTLVQIASGVKLRICYRENVDLWERM